MKPKNGDWQSYKSEFIAQLESGVLSGRFPRGERLPAERQLSVIFKVSRPVVHDALKTLEAKGLVSIKPRKGVYVNDYRRQGSLELLFSILRHSKPPLKDDLRDGLLEFREGFERKITLLALERADEAGVRAIRACVDGLSKLKSASIADKLKADFDFHHEVSIASGNPVAAMIFNSFRNTYELLVRNLYAVPGYWNDVVAARTKIVEAIERRDEKAARAALDRLSEISAKAFGNAVGLAARSEDAKPKRGTGAGASEGKTARTVKDAAIGKAGAKRAGGTAKPKRTRGAPVSAKRRT